MEEYDRQVPSDAGFVGIVNSSKIIVKDLTMTGNFQGVLLAFSDKSTIENVTAPANMYGIYMIESSENNLTGNIISDNNGEGILIQSSDMNLIYNNYFDNANNAQDDGTNVWNTTPTSGEDIIGGSWLGGNYWSDYAGVDNNGDGLGDTMRPYISSDNIQQGGDWHPLVDVATSLPDLKITDIWICWPENCKICYNVTNVGIGTALVGHNTLLLVDGTEETYDCVTEGLLPNESYIGCFEDYNWIYTPLEDNITVCADCNNTVSECNESNNCLHNTWKCGDVDMDGEVDFLGDVRGVARYYRYDDPIKCPWAGDVDCRGGIDFLGDVRGIARHYMYGEPLNCCCGQG